ncbi:MAG: Imm1 family immunity protein [Sciscionella sp.]
MVAADPGRYGMLVRMLLQHPYPGYPDVHVRTSFYVTDQPVLDFTNNEWPRRWLRVGFHDGYGGVFFGDETTADDEDWAWLALASEPLTEAPLVYFDQDGEVAFPPGAVMPLDEVQAVVLEWVRTSERPRSVDWLTINTLVWHLTNDGQVDVPSRSS